MSTKIGPRTARSSSSTLLGRVVGEEGLLPLGEQLAQRPPTRHHVLDLAGVKGVLERSGADVPAGHRVDLDTERRRAAQLDRQVGRDDRPELDDRIVALVLHPPGADHQARPVERQVGRVEEEDLADLGIDRVHAQCRDRRALIGLRDGELELDAVGAADQVAQLGELVVDEPRARHEAGATTAGAPLRSLSPT